MGLEIPGDKELMEMYMALWKEIEEQLNVSLETVVKNNAFIKPKLITWGGQYKINFDGTDISFGSSVKVTTVLKVAKSCI